MGMNDVSVITAEGVSTSAIGRETALERARQSLREAISGE